MTYLDVELWIAHSVRVVTSKLPFHFVNLNTVNTHVLLWGENAISDNENKHWFSLVYRIILKYCRI